MSLDRSRPAIVPGASRGIGAAPVRQLCIGGLDVYAVARSADDLSELARETGCRPLALDTPVAKLLPESVKVPSRNGKQITLLDISMQVSGLPRMPSNFHPADDDN